LVEGTARGVLKRHRLMQKGPHREVYDIANIQELLEGTFFQRLFELIEVLPTVRSNAIQRVKKAQEIMKRKH
ncbi:1296_t:CDS:2, partial [Racocetra fulgida]